MPPFRSVLIVDDEPAVRDIMARWVASLGLDAAAASNADEALAMLRTQECDLAVIDLMMPGRDGLWLADEMRREYPGTALVLATAYTSLLQGERTPPPVADLLVKPFARERFALAVDRGRQWHKEALDDLQWHARLSLELRERTETLCETLEQRTRAGERAVDVLTALAAKYSSNLLPHSRRVTRFAMSIARELRLDARAAASLEDAAMLHDIGKLAISESLLEKPSPLTRGEQAIVRQHVDAGAEILASTTELHELAPVVLATHEWYGGGGYPLKLSGEGIPLASRIIAVADAYDAMTQTRIYRAALDSGEALSELLRCVGTQFDPDVITAFLAVLGWH